MCKEFNENFKYTYKQMLLLRISIWFHDHEIKYTLITFFLNIPLHMHEGTPFCCLCSPLKMATTAMKADLLQALEEKEERFYLVPYSQWDISKHTENVFSLLLCTHA